MRVQYTLSMEPAAIAPPRRRGKVERKYIIEDSSANILDQIHMIDQEGHTKSAIVEESLRITAHLVNYTGSVSKAKEFVSDLSTDREKPL